VDDYAYCQGWISTSVLKEKQERGSETNKR